MASVREPVAARIKIGPLGRIWQISSTVIALIGLAAFCSRFIRWAPAIQRAIDTYTTMKSWLLGWPLTWLPFHSSGAMGDLVEVQVLLIFLSVGNVGFYRRTGTTFSKHAFHSIAFILLFLILFLPSLVSAPIDRLLTRWMDWSEKESPDLAIKSDKVASFMVTCVVVFLVLVGAYFWSYFLLVSLDVERIHEFDPVVLIRRPLGNGPDGSIGAGLSFLILLFFTSFGGLLAWRWVLSTASLFLVLVGANYAYMQLL